MKKSYIAMVALAIFIKFYEKNIQISEKNFFNNFYPNTTQIDFYHNNTAYIYLNNDTKTSHFLNVESKEDFLKELKVRDFQYDYLFKETPMFLKKIIDYGMIIVFFGMLMMSRGLMTMGFSSYIKSNNKVSVKLKDVAGLEYNKKEIFEFVDFLKNRDKYLKIGARMPRGALLHGPPGTGKTLLAKAVAGECGISFISVSGSDFSQMFVGVGASRVRSLFKEAREKAPCIIFIDEIDALARSRNKCSVGGAGAERDNTLNRLLVELDGFEDNDNVLLFGATNRLDILDKALLRPGRFDRKIRFELPEKKDREEIFKYYLKKMSIEEDIGELSKKLGRISIGFSCADIANICNEGSILSVRKETEFVSLKILEEAIDNVILGPEKKTFRLTDNERRQVAYHESGHAIISYFFEHTQPPIKVSIMPRGASALGFSQSDSKDTKLHSKSELKDKMAVLLGGRIAEEIFCDDFTTGASDDIEKLTSLAYKFVCVYGMSSIGPYYCNWRDKQISEELKKNIDSNVKVLIDEAYLRAKEFITKNQEKVHKLAKELLEKETLVAEDLEKILN
jgi:AFG3 family protein